MRLLEIVKAEGTQSREIIRDVIHELVQLLCIQTAMSTRDIVYSNRS